MILASIHWDPHPIMFYLPYLNWPVRWYGFFFAFGFFLAYYLIKSLFESNGVSNEKARSLTDKLCWFSVFGTILGARLGHILFYDIQHYIENPLNILKTWEGGLASHGGVIGILIALWFYYLYVLKKELPDWSFLRLLDQYSVAVPLAAFFIRLGNFFNQEIIGTPTQLPWGVYFGHPYEGYPWISYHPTQMYEGVAYLITFAALMYFWTQRRKSLNDGYITGMFFILVFGSRFILEFLKAPQGGVSAEAYLQMGQILSLPCIILGLVLISYARRPKASMDPESRIR